LEAVGAPTQPGIIPYLALLLLLVAVEAVLGLLRKTLVATAALVAAAHKQPEDLETRQTPLHRKETTAALDHLLRQITALAAAVARPLLEAMEPLLLAVTAVRERPQLFLARL
jgi:hypothetical protein